MQLMQHYSNNYDYYAYDDRDRDHTFYIPIHLEPRELGTSALALF